MFFSTLQNDACFLFVFFSYSFNQYEIYCISDIDNNLSYTMIVKTLYLNLKELIMKQRRDSKNNYNVIEGGKHGKIKVRTILECSLTKYNPGLQTRASVFVSLYGLHLTELFGNRLAVSLFILNSAIVLSNNLHSQANFTSETSSSPAFWLPSPTCNITQNCSISETTH